jgi:enediyne biosynthesis protein E4
MTRKCCLILFFYCLGFLSCSHKKETLFSLLESNDTNIDFKNILKESEDANVLNYTYFYNGGGVAVGDINDDGLTDILFTGNMVPNRLYLNKGNCKFEDITQKAGIAEKQGWCTGAIMADVNGDGKLDIYICRSADANPERRKNLLYINNGNLTFSEQAAQYGLADNGYSTQAAFFDYDKDGDLDMFLINHSLKEYAGDVFTNPVLRKEQQPAYASKLYRNDNGHFMNVSGQAGITNNVLSFGLGLAISDVNSDGWPDVYVSNDFNEPDYLFINNGNGTFSETLSDCMDESSFFSMGSDCADYNNDGLTDIVTLDMLPEDNLTQKLHSGAENFDKFQLLFNNGFYYQYSRNMLHRNNGDGTFSETGQLAGISNTDWSWAALFSDFDNDGYKDLFITNGYVKDNTNMDFIKYRIDRIVNERRHGQPFSGADLLAKMPSVSMPNYVFQNDSGINFTNKIKDWGLDRATISSGAAYADLDNDGDMDLIINNTNEAANVYRNNAEKIYPGNHYIKIKLQGNNKNSDGIGTKIKVFCKGSLYYQEQMPERGFQSSVDPVLNIGIGKNEKIDSILVIWNDDRMQRLVDVKANQLLSIKWLNATAELKDDTLPAEKKYFTADSLISFTHRENLFNDFNVQSLLPGYLSRQGPCMAKADINNDGREDLFIGAAKGEPSQVFTQAANGQFIRMPQPAIEKDLICEDVAAAFFDADKDGDADLYVCSGGYEFAENDLALQDRLYLNTGNGSFIKSEKALPLMPASTGCVKAADVDGDGDIDLFIGGRLVPGKYPSTPGSQILVNDGKGIFKDVTLEIAPQVKGTGMVTDALWLDINNDQQKDLVIVGEWMPVKIFINQHGKFVDASDQYIKFPSFGWWNTVTGADFDHDGDIDIVIGNCGENTQFRVSEKKPMTLYYKDFDANGSVDPVLCYYIGDTSYPAASRDDITDQLPFLRKKFLEYHNYASATVNELFTPEQLKDAGQLKATTMRTIYLENKGAEGFAERELPPEAQYAPVYSIAVTDVNGDGNQDMIFTGNNAWTRIKFGRYRANHGMVFLGDGKNHFGYLPQGRNGLNVRADVRSSLLLNAGGKQELILGVNNDRVKCYRILKGQ